MEQKESFVKLHEAPFARRGSYMMFLSGDLAEQSFGLGELWLGSQRGAASMMVRNRLIKFTPVWHGEPVPYSITTTPYRIHCLLHRCWQPRQVLRFQRARRFAQEQPLELPEPQ
jgi:hypothetical protein